MEAEQQFGMSMRDLLAIPAARKASDTSDNVNMGDVSDSGTV